MNRHPILQSAVEAYPDVEKLMRYFKELFVAMPSQYDNDFKGFRNFVGDIRQCKQHDADVAAFNEWHDSLKSGEGYTALGMWLAAVEYARRAK